MSVIWACSNSLEVTSARESLDHRWTRYLKMGQTIHKNCVDDSNLNISLHAWILHANVALQATLPWDSLLAPLAMHPSHRNNERSLPCDAILEKLCFPAFAWNVTGERNGRIFGSKERQWGAVLRETFDQIRSRFEYLNLRVTSHLAAAWNVPGRAPMRRARPITVRAPWDLLISTKNGICLGILKNKDDSIVWVTQDSLHDPVTAAIGFMSEAVSSAHMPTVLFYERSIRDNVREPHNSPWKCRLQACKAARAFIQLKLRFCDHLDYIAFKCLKQVALVSLFWLALQWCFTKRARFLFSSY